MKAILLASLLLGTTVSARAAVVYCTENRHGRDRLTLQVQELEDRSRGPEGRGHNAVYFAQVSLFAEGRASALRYFRTNVYVDDVVYGFESRAQAIRFKFFLDEPEEAYLDFEDESGRRRSVVMSCERGGAEPTATGRNFRRRR